MPNDTRVHGADFIKLAVLLQTFRDLLGLPRAVFARGEVCPNCGPHVLMLRQDGRDGESTVITCTKCAYIRRENEDTAGLDGRREPSL
jgi:ribosomal protein S27AE